MSVEDIPMSGETVVPPRFDAVVFDMDGLLVDSETMALEAIRTAGLQIGIDVPASLRQLMIGLPADSCKRLVIERYGDSQLAETLFKVAAEHHRAKVEDGHLRLKEGVSTLLDILDSAGLPKAVATSSSRFKAEMHLNATAVLHRFDVIVTRDDVDRGKPWPDLFEKAASELGLSPGRCLALEDSHNGVRAAHAAGMAVVMVPDLLKPTAEMHQLCVAVVKTVAHVVSILGLDNQHPGSPAPTGSTQEKQAMSPEATLIDRFVAVDTDGKRYYVDVYQPMIVHQTPEGEPVDIPGKTFLRTLDGDEIDVGADGALTLAMSGKLLKKLGVN
jgi:HAD superfamily hydrolase (TIGR01509 family)